MFVRVFGDTFLNLGAVGKLTVTQTILAGVRNTVTAAFDMSGQHPLGVLDTSLRCEGEYDEEAVKRDNFIHREFLDAVRDGRDARTWLSLTDEERDRASKVGK